MLKDILTTQYLWISYYHNYWLFVYIEISSLNILLSISMFHMILYQVIWYNGVSYCIMTQSYHTKYMKQYFEYLKIKSCDTWHVIHYHLVYCNIVSYDKIYDMWWNIILLYPHSKGEECVLFYSCVSVLLSVRN